MKIKNNKIFYFGEKGSFTYIAACKYFSKIKNMFAVLNLEKVFDKVNKNRNCFGIVPWENSTTGSISQTYDLLVQKKLFVTGEIFLKVHHYLLGIQKLPLNKIKVCYSHKQALTQCRKFLNKYPSMKIIETTDTASACKMVKNKKRAHEVAIGSLKAAGNSSLMILENKIEDNINNFTRFAIISNKNNINGNKISLIFNVKHKPGSLFKALKPYADHQFNLTKIESRPITGKLWEYLFYLDFEISGKEEKVESLIKEMKKNTMFLKVIGRYKKGEIYET